MARYGEKNYRIGVDVGDRSVGLACIEFDEQQMPINILRAVSFRHDGGLDPTTNKTPKSRKETAGVARRVRRMRKRRAARLKKLDQLLVSHGFPVIDVSQGETYECWESRARCVEGFIRDESERKEAISRSLRHMARHRGWRNPWLSWNGFTEVETPTTQHKANLSSANAKLGLELDEDATLGQIAVAASRTNYVLRPRDAHKRKNEYILSHQVQQADQLHELQQILATQEVPEPIAGKLCKAVFEQVRPYVPDENIGRDSLPGMGHLRRASRSSLAFQEFRVRAAVANLRVKDSPRSKTSRPLNLEDRLSVVDLLMNWHEEGAPAWADVAILLSIDANLLVTPTFEESLLKLAPYDKTSRDFEQKLTASNRKKLFTPVREFWEETTPEMRELLIEFISSPTDDVYEMADESGLSDALNSWSDDVKSALMDTDFESGRAAYSLESLRRLNARMRTEPVDLHEARKLEFDVDDSWQPPLPSLDERTGQPAVDRVLTIVRRFVMGAVDKWGVPQSIVVEHAREGFMGAAARDDLLKEISQRTAQRHDVARVVAGLGIERPSSRDILKYECIRRQRNGCAYCGGEIGQRSAELDHIVPRAGGGSNARDNLVATCRRCNDAKGRTPFAVFASSGIVPEAELRETIQRVRSWDWQRNEQRIKQRMINRLKRTEEDPEIDERSLASTSYAAVEVRARLAEYLSRQTGEVERHKIEVYSGGVSREARRSGQIDSTIRIRGKNEKDRFDVRHHAIDAAVMTLLNSSIALTLEERSQRRRTAHLNPRIDPNETWREFTGRSVKAQERFALWRQQSYKLADLLVTAIADDAIPVAQQLRLGPSRGAIHKDTIIPLAAKAVGGEWSRTDLMRIADPEVYGQMRALASTKLTLPADADRSVTLRGSTVLTREREIPVFAKAAASIVVNGGSVEIGEQIHHARVYRWKNKRGEFEFGILRVFAAELPWLQRQANSKDILRMSIDSRSMSYRDLQPGVMAKIESDEAVEVGWLAMNDELVLDVPGLAAGTDKLAHFLRQYPESRWKLDGFPRNRQLRIRPLYLAREGAGEMDEICVDVLTQGAIITVSGSLVRVLEVVRRDGMGTARWRSSSRNLPVSWNPSDES